MGNKRPEFFCVGWHFYHIRGDKGRYTFGNVDCRPMLAKVMSRVPASEATRLHYTHFLMVGPRTAENLSNALLRDMCLVVLGEELLTLMESEQAQIVLPLLAQAILKARHAYEETYTLADCIDPTTGGFDYGKLRRELKRLGKARRQARIDARLQKQEAEALARAWAVRWERYQETPEACWWKDHWRKWEVKQQKAEEAVRLRGSSGGVGAS